MFERVRRTLITGALAFTAVAAVTVLSVPSTAGATASSRVVSTSATIAREASAALGLLAAHERTQQPRVLLAYTAHRDEVAGRVAADLGLDPAQLRQAWAATDVTHQKALLAAITQLGVPYRSHSSIAGKGFDCSGLTAYAWSVAGVTLHRQSRAQINAAARVEHEQALAGDLVFYPGHVMMYLGVGDAIVHSPQSGLTVELTVLSDRRASSVRYGDPLA